MRNEAVRGTMRAAWLAALALTGAGCASHGTKFNKAAATRVTAAAPPAEKPERLTPLPEEYWWGKLVGAPPAAFADAHNARFAEAREAYWSRDTARATELLRQLQAEGAITAPKFHLLFLQCYERDGRWAETLPLYAELGIGELRREWREFAEKQAAEPRLTVAFAPGESVVPCTLWRDELVIVDIELNGAKARVLLDTGAGMSWWTKALVERAGLERLGDKMNVVDANGRASAGERVRARELKLGGLTARNVTAASGRSLTFATQLGIDGIVGWDVLREAHLVFDFPRRQVRISAPEGGVVAEPNVGGRLLPIFLARSAEGRPLHLFYDSGAGSSAGGVDLFRTDGVIASKVDTTDFGRNWKPNVGWGLHSMHVHWPRKRSPFTFWLAGYSFETPVADLMNREELHDGWSYLDGVLGNASFLSGRLTLCGVRRLMAFEPAPPGRDVATTAAATGGVKN